MARCCYPWSGVWVLPMAGAKDKVMYKCIENIQTCVNGNCSPQCVEDTHCPDGYPCNDYGWWETKHKDLSLHLKGASRMRVDAQTITSVLVLILFVTSLPTTTASTVTLQQTAQRVRNVIQALAEMVPSLPCFLCLMYHAKMVHLVGAWW